MSTHTCRRASRHQARQNYRRFFALEPLEERKVLATWFVNDDALGANTGANWGNAYNNLQSALASANSGDEIWVAEGVYKPSGVDRAASFQLKTGVSLYGGFAGTESLISERQIAAHPAILSGEIGAAGDADNSFHVVVASLVTNARLDGFTLTGGNANLNYDHDSGGGLYVYNASLTVSNSTITGNTAIQGGGIGTEGIGSDMSFVTLERTTISGNSAMQGAGVCLFYATANVTDSTISGNAVTADYQRGGGFLVSSGSTLNLVNATISGNSSKEGGGGIGNYGTLTAINTTIAGNTGTFGGGMFTTMPSVTLRNTIVAGNTGQDVSGTIVANNSLIQNVSGTTFGAGSSDNLTGIDPLLGALGNYGGPTQTMRLLTGSPAIDMGSGAYAPTSDQRGVPRYLAPDMGAFEANPFVVTTLLDETTDNGFTSLREAIASANSIPGDDTVTFLSGLNGAINFSTAAGGQGILSLTSNVTIDGAGASIVLEGGSTPGASSNAQVLDVNIGIVVNLSHLTIRNGYAPGYGGGIWNNGVLTITDCLFQGNSASRGSAIGTRHGGVNVIDSTFVDNFGGDSVLYSESSMNVANSAVTDNQASGIVGLTLTVSNSTIANNSGYGVLAWNDASLTNSVLAHNAIEDFYGSAAPGSTHNLVQVAPNASGLVNGVDGNLIGVDPLFVDPAQKNYRLLAASPAIDAGTNSGAPDHDLDAVPRPFDGDYNGVATVDMGAYEYHNARPVADANGPYFAAFGQQLSLSAAGSYDPDAGDSIVEYAWDLDNDGQFDDAVGAAPVIAWAALAGLPLNTSLPIALKVTDTWGATATASTTLYVQGADLGDARAPYPTTLAENGAWHLAFGPQLGPNRDVESDGTHSFAATADDQTGSPDDEDGVTGLALIPGQTNTLTIDLQNPSTWPLTNYLNAWIDFNFDGDWNDTGERIATDLDLGTNAGLKSLNVPLPWVALGNTTGRFRVSTQTGLGPTGGANDGEVEDHAVSISYIVDDGNPTTDDSYEVGVGPVYTPHGDWGDAPAPYSTTLAGNGAWHRAFGPMLGSARDVEVEGQPSTTANGDDAAGAADEDGVTFAGLAIGRTALTTVVVTGGSGKLDAFVDFNRDGDWTDVGEKIFDSVDVQAGSNPLSFAIPETALAGTTYARFRLSTTGGLSSVWGVMGAGGEVEDYQMVIDTAPVADAQSVTTAEDTPKAITLTGSDLEGDSLTYIVVTQPAHGTLSGTAPSLTYTPAGNYNGPDSFTFQVNDGTVDSEIATVSLTITAVDDPATATNLSAAETYTEDTPLNLTDIVVSDIDSANVTVTLTLSNTAAGSLSTATSGSVTSTFSAGTGVWTASGAIADVNVLLAGLTFIPASNFNGNFTIFTSISDSEAGNKAMTGSAVNDAPTATNLSAAETYTEDTALNLTDIVVSDMDSANVTATLTLSNTAAGSLSTGTSGSVTSTFNAGTGVWTASGAIADVNALLADLTFTPASNFNGNFTINTSVSDNVATAITGSKLMSGSAVNDAPTANPQNVTVAGNTSVAVALTGSDVDGNPLTYVVVSAPAHGTLSGTAPNLTYTPTHNYSGPDSFTFKVNDGTVDSPSAVVSITVTPATSTLFVVGFNPQTGSWQGTTLPQAGASQTKQLAQWATLSQAGWQNGLTGDFDGDGTMDVAARNSNGAWYVGASQTGGYATSVWGGFVAYYPWSSIQVGDVNADGKDDIVGYLPAFGEWWAAISTGSSFQNYVLARFSTSVTWSDFLVADFTGDGRDDVAARTNYGEWWMGETSASVGTPARLDKLTTWSTAVTWRDVKAADMNGDGMQDIVGRADFSGSDGSEWWLAQTRLAAPNDYVGDLSALALWYEPVGWTVVIADTNGDGSDEILGRTSYGEWWQASKLLGKNTVKLGQWDNTTWDSTLVGDVDGDGKEDLVGLKSSGPWTVSRFPAGPGSQVDTTPASWSASVDWLFTALGEDQHLLFP